ncbi:asparagine synthase-related protein [Agrobacterium sp. LAD9]|uniref:asparagine synthase-related protein n=1 Tax=Agrobacterium sp. LAD9 TaxID=2055153 RepID=UPI000D1F4953|nr:asparagine synthase-related protein [Agrobacterium sp. LAD9]
MLFIAPHGHPSLHSCEVRTATMQCNRHQNDRFTFYYDGTYNLINLAEGKALVSGTGYCGKQEILACTTTLQLSNFLKEAVGFFTVVFIAADRFEVTTSLYRHKDVFYWQAGNEWLVADTLTGFDRTIGRRNLNARYAREFVLDSLASGPETLFEGVYQVEIGTTIAFDGCVGIKRTVGNFPSAPKEGLAEELICNIRRFAAGKDRVIVRFSGGIDSSLILAAAKEALGSCEAIHTIIPEERQNTEFGIAEKVAQDLGCKLRILHSEYWLSHPRRSQFCGSKSVTSPFDVYPFSHDATDRSGAFLESFERIDTSRTLFLSGQGGDNVFLQNPPPYIVKDALFSRGPHAFAQEAIKFCRLKNVPLLDVIRKAFWNQTAGADVAERLIDVPATPPHLLLERHRPKTAKYYHLRSILEALQQYETSTEFGVSSLHPLLFQNVISSALSIEPHDLYSKRFDRMPQRQVLHSRYHLDVAWRRTKKAATSAVFMFFMNNKDLIHDTLVDGFIAPALSVDHAWLRKEIDYNGSVAITDSFALFYNMLRLEIFCRQHCAKLNFIAD